MQLHPLFYHRVGLAANTALSLFILNYTMCLPDSIQSSNKDFTRLNKQYWNELIPRIRKLETQLDRVGSAFSPP